jgi:hypothetical protein
MGVCAAKEKPLHIVNHRLQQRLREKEDHILQLRGELKELVGYLRTSEEYKLQTGLMEQRISRLFLASNQLEADICEATIWTDKQLHQDNLPVLIRFIQQWVNTPINQQWVNTPINQQEIPSVSE